LETIMGLQNISDMEVFVKTIALGSMSAAARSLDVTPAAVSYRLTRLETSLGTRLLHRTTRQLSLTSDGEEYLRWAQRLTAELHDAENAISRRQEVPRGVLKLAVPSSFGRQMIAPMLPRYLAEYPEVRVAMTLNDEIVDIIGQGMDLAIRISEMKDSGLISRKLADDRRILCASPDYLRRCGTPTSIEDLAHHNCLLLSNQAHWNLQGPGGPMRLSVAGNFECNNGEVLREMAIAGVGIALKATWDIAEALNSGKLLPVLPDYPVISKASICAVYPSRRNVPAKVSSFITFFGEHIAEV
jgi:DNA-binding transcriptional LysR family regulator